MNIHYVSDLHNESNEWSPKKSNINDILVVAGDIDVSGKASKWLIKMSKLYKHVVAVLGNHDYWYNDINKTLDEMKEDIKNYKNISILDGSSLIIDNVRFIGATLWTKVPPEAFGVIKSTMKDYNFIKNDDESLTVDYINNLHDLQKQKIINILSTPFDGMNIVVSHHAPTSLSIDERYKNHSQGYLLNSAYHSDLSSIINNYDVSAWFHGHTHHSFEYQAGNCTIFCNPRGYYPDRLNKDFEEKILDINTLSKNKLPSYDDLFSLSI